LGQELNDMSALLAIKGVSKPKVNEKARQKAKK